MDLKLINEQNQDVGSVSVADSLFDREYNETLVHQVVTSYLSNSRAATRAQKGRSDVAKSKHKPWKQKGTGRARAGSASSPIWRGGGKTFPNSPDENFQKKLNKKMYRAGMSTIFSELIRKERLFVIESITLTSHKTKELSEKLQFLGFDEVLIVTHEMERNLSLSSRNLPKAMALHTNHADPVSLLKYKYTLVTSDGIKKIEELLS